jgi:predicted DNA-binding transcriptional regulator YafY
MWNRVLWLDGQLRQDAAPSWESLREEFGVSRRTALDTVRFLRESLGAPVQYSKRRKGYVYAQAGYALPSVLMGEGEFLAVVLAMQASRQMLGTSVGQALEQTLSKLVGALPEHVHVDLAALRNSVYVGGLEPENVPVEMLRDFERAARERRLLELTYYTISRDEVGTRVVEPHLLMSVNGKWQLVCWDPGQGGDRSFKLERVRQYRVLDETFERRPQLAREEYVAGGFFSEFGLEPVEVVLRFDAWQARWIRERRWHASQRLEKLDDGGVLLRMRVAAGDELLRWILSYGGHVQLLKPEWLAHKVADVAESLLRQYDRKPPA